MEAPAAAPVRIGVVDSGASPVQAARVRSAAAFVFEDGALCRVAAQPDRLGHGSRLVDIIGLLAPDAELCVAQVFRERLATSAAQVAAAIDWLVEERVQLINLSLGLREPRPVLAEACARALAAGVILCASAPARGAPVYPAAFPGVLRMTGDARCGRLEISALGTQYADFGAHVRPLEAGAAPGMAGSGASIGCAHLSGHIGRYLAAGGRAEPAAVRQWLAAEARYHGAEHRRS
jgi:hypothetical protein